MSEDLGTLIAQLKKVEKELEETEKRMPAHSVKPPVMEDLFRLEDEKAELLQKIKALQ